MCWHRLTVGTKLFIIAIVNGQSHIRHQAIICTNDNLSSIWPFERNFSKIRIKIWRFSFMKRYFKMWSAKWQPFCIDFYVLNWCSSHAITVMSHERNGTSNHRQVDYLCNSLSKPTSMKRSKSVLLALSEENHQWPLDSPHKGPSTREAFPCHPVTMCYFSVACIYQAITRPSATPYWYALYIRTIRKTS